ncbi:MAG TPA: alpha-2-macroglobulin family protein [Flavitalea sp.]|nr:alpha-2-macroglobulin family protein [Flavitalea sp.]
MLLKKLFLLLSFSFFISIVMAQKKLNTYQQSWNKIDTLVNKKGLVKTALEEVNKIYLAAKKEKNDPQAIKALLYRASLQEQLSENAALENIADLEKETAASKEPATSILYSITAEAYWSYLQQNRWKLYNRTATAGYDKKDPATWGIDDLHQKISGLYLSSIQQEKKLQQTLLEAYDPIIIKGNTRHLRPTLFDLLAHRALEYFTNDERDIRKPAYAFEIADKEAFAGAGDFAAHRFVSADSLSLHYKALQLFQQLIRFHLSDAKPDALIDADIARIQFVHSFGTQENKTGLYKQALEDLIKKYPGSAARARHLLAEWYVSQAAAYDPLTDTANRYAYLEAKKICQPVLAQKGESPEKYDCSLLLKSIERKEIKIQAEKVNIPNSAFRILLTYRNTPAVYFRIVDMSKKKDARETWKEGYWKELLKTPAIRSFTNALPDTKDHQQHHIELKVDGLPPGEYALIASSEKSFALQSSIISLQSFHVSDLSYINKGNQYYVLHRESGAPVPAAKVQLWRQRYDYTANKNILQKGELLTADKNGFFKTPEVPGDKNNFPIRLEISTPNDRLFLDDLVYAYYYRPDLNAEKKEKAHSFLFSDRSLYRPGQIVYFKGIKVLRGKSGSESTVMGNSKSTIILYNANREPVDSLTLTTNAFGSYAGKFTLPSSGLNGNFTLRDNTAENEIYFSVEEYKRPKFYVEIPKPAGTYKLFDSIQVDGAAKAYAGNNINNATVSYRVIRRSIIPFYAFPASYLPRIWPPYQQQQAEIAHGVTATDSEGKFRIRFVAQPDKTIDKKNQPLFYYEINADITDINGETRSGAVSMTIAYQAIKLQIDAPEKISADSLKAIGVLATNMNDAEEKTTAAVAIHRLAMPDRIFRERYWRQPDQFIMSREEYYRLFPYDPYADENEITNWAKEEKVFETEGATSANRGFALNARSWKSGWYLIEASTVDKYGETVTSKRYLQLYNPALKSSFASGNIELDRATAAPGETVRYQLNTNLDNVFVIHELAGKTVGEKTDYLTLNNNSRAYDIKITEKDRGVILMNMSFVKHNRMYSDQRAINIPFSNKELSIDYITYRDKTLPGASEQWKIKIRGHNKDKAAAEVLMTMYDASLDQFHPHRWNIPSIWSTDVSLGRWSGRVNFLSQASVEKYPPEKYPDATLKEYDRLNTSFAAGPVYRYDMMRANKAVSIGRELMGAAPGVALQAEESAKKEMIADDAAEPPAPPDMAEGSADASPQNVQIRKNFDETAFFFPQLQTDAEGNLEFSFTTSEALTQWKWMLLAHDKELAFGYGEKQMVTQKPLMVQPNAPRFLREGDRIDFSAKIVNLSDREITGQVELQLIDPSTGKSVDGYFKNVIPNQYFTAAAGQSTPVRFSIDIPFQYNKPVAYRIIAGADIADSTNHISRISDGEESLLPVISNRMLVTETLPLPVRGAGAHAFRFDKLLQSGGSETLQHHSLSVEFTANPAWYAVQALPYLAENLYDNAEQFFNRYYANALAVKIANASPRLREIVEEWKKSDTAALLSALQKNEELKNILLEETPWVLEAKTESQQKKNIALLFDMVRMSGELESALARLQEFQSPNGGFVWLKGGPDDRYMTQHILSGIGRLKNMQAIPEAGAQQLESIVRSGLSYLDKKIKEDYENLKKHNKNITDLWPGHIQILYLYMRSFFSDREVPKNVLPAYQYYRNQAKKYWLKQSRYMQGLIALSLYRSGDAQTAKNIMASIKQYAMVNNEMGMYWKDMVYGYYWHQAPVEMHALMIEAFTEITNDTRATDDLKTWLIKNKQTNSWKTSKATADACYALLLRGTDWLEEAPEVKIKMGALTLSATDHERPGTGNQRNDAVGKPISSNGRPAEAGTGYFKRTIAADKINASMGNIEVNLSSAPGAAAARPAWGAAYWQYFEDLDKITPASTPLKLDKKLFVEKYTDRGPVLEPLNNTHTLYVGDKVRVRIELRADRDMEYVHMKDMRAACMEPVNVISRYNWQGGLGYYESTKDASANFFFDHLRKGTYVFEYSLFVTHTGAFSNGIATIQSMYAPEFSSHSEGIKLNVEEK